MGFASLIVSVCPEILIHISYRYVTFGNESVSMIKYVLIDMTETDFSVYSLVGRGR